jgi:hypothetical protein
LGYATESPGLKKSFKRTPSNDEARAAAPDMNFGRLDTWLEGKAQRSAVFNPCCAFDNLLDAKVSVWERLESWGFESVVYPGEHSGLVAGFEAGASASAASEVLYRRVLEGRRAGHALVSLSSSP